MTTFAPWGKTFREKLILGATLGLSLFSLNAFAEDLVPPPAEILKRARVSRSEFSDIMYELRSAVPDLETKEKLEPYLMILEELRIIQLELEFSSMDATLILDVSDKLTAVMESKLNLGEDSEVLLTEFSRWAPEWTRGSFCSNQEAIISRTNDKGQLFKMMDRLSAIIKILQVPAPLSNGLRPSTDAYANLQARLNQKLIDDHMSDLQLSEYADFLSHVESPLVVTGSFDSFHRSVFVLSDPVQLTKIVNMLVMTRERLGELKVFVSDDVKVRPGAIIGSALIKIIDSGGTLDGALTERAMAIMDPIQLDALGTAMAGVDLFHNDPERFRFVRVICLSLANHYGLFGMTRQQKIAVDLANRVGLAIRLNEKNVEGMYEIVIGGRPGWFTLARGDNTELISAISYGSVTASMAYAHFDQSNGTFHASSVRDEFAPTELSPGAAEVPTQYMRFRLEPAVGEAGGMRVTGKLLIGHREQAFSGTRTKSLTDYLNPVPMAVPEITDFHGGYEGKFLGYDAVLRISPNGSANVASLMISPREHQNLIKFDLVHLDPRTGGIYLTSRQRVAFFQIRAQLERGKIVGQYVIGGRAEPINFSLVKSTDEAAL